VRFYRSWFNVSGASNGVVLSGYTHNLHRRLFKKYRLG